ncbi:endonuclease/exonuclease/phosphatase family protein [Ktedonobacter robiniae]|uniref:Endonuclease/exonuclease/phosphatase domain-containing protein n=1 Tax=Ktedonobacter robiniae TaxID=2778365 RepID=A0ABQ3UH75_9CHLR|nr:endonuclease/exonuclease/phosphatase family protein [Ktedonobacter robiniae]GHO51935.1 hypothetical protein KSB_04100 [Ktedonobacter robiniae]
MADNWFVRLWQKQRFKVLTIGASLYVLLVLIFLISHAIAPQRVGLLALAGIFAPYLFAPLALLVPFLFLRFTALLRIAFAIGVILFGLCFSPRLGAGNAQSIEGGRTITAMTWNFLGDNTRGGYVRQLINTHHPDLIALQEADWNGIDEAQDILRQYPYHLYGSGETPPGEVLLSTLPILDHGQVTAPDGSRAVWDIPRILWARLDLGHGQTLFVVNAHPISSINTVYGCLFCPQRRDSQIKALHQFLQPFIQHGERLLLLGDMNTTDREPAYQDLSAGLQDTHLLVGKGSGHSWGIRGLNQYWAFLRIDYMFVTPKVKPLSLDTDCTSRGSDHCVLIGKFSI